ncbi:hypothetical protein D9756_005804 [Leucocoprinus leucothites]|uniref:Uncharacterized protein n=1 Tax=Leucocoprinus leucothites TaxID=201217 RepID=A0A8H5D473_9AGAR|nr:hypothetical protein D9756_005804 [Leucoagaricus leucothites]
MTMTNSLPADDTEIHGFPPGYFVVRSVATNRLLDVKADDVEDGAEIVLWPEKETSLVEGFRDPNANNQVFFIDTSGVLCSRSSGHALDIEGDRLVLRHRRPVSSPYPNAYSHPLPKFRYDSRTGEITIQFDYDPTFPLSSPLSASTGGTGRSDSWRNKTYYLVSQPMRKPRTIIDDASEILTSAISSPINFFGGAFGGKGASKPDEVFDGNIDLKEDDIVDEDRGEEGEVDDSPEVGRHARMINVVKGSEGELSGKTQRRRQWAVSSLRRINAKTGGT